MPRPARARGASVRDRRGPRRDLGTWRSRAAVAFGETCAPMLCGCSRAALAAQSWRAARFASGSRGIVLARARPQRLRRRHARRAPIGHPRLQPLPPGAREDRRCWRSA
jgi:hypothetical protein